MIHKFGEVIFELGRAINNVVATCRAMPMMSRVEKTPAWAVGERKKELEDLMAAQAKSLEELKQSTKRGMGAALRLVDKLADLIAFVSVKAQAERIEKMLEGDLKPDELLRAAEELGDRMADELGGHWFIYLRPELERLYQSEKPLFGDDVERKFVSAKYHINEAGKCLALDRSTATVFHLMGVVERGLHALRASLRLPEPANPQQKTWGSMLPAIKTEMDRRDTARAWGAPPDATFFRELHASLVAIKGAYRDPTMHVESTYTESEARHIFNVTDGFMRKLASRVDENGDPKQP
jgi:hypothetical protein